MWKFFAVWRNAWGSTRTASGRGAVAAYLKKGLKVIFDQQKPSALGMALVSDEENVVLISEEAIQSLPAPLAKGGRISRLPPHLVDHPLPLKTDKCIPVRE